MRRRPAPVVVAPPRPDPAPLRRVLGRACQVRAALVALLPSLGPGEQAEIRHLVVRLEGMIARLRTALASV